MRRRGALLSSAKLSSASAPCLLTRRSKGSLLAILSGTFTGPATRQEATSRAAAEGQGRGRGDWQHHRAGPPRRMWRPVWSPRMARPNTPGCTPAAFLRLWVHQSTRGRGAGPGRQAGATAARPCQYRHDDGRVWAPFPYLRRRGGTRCRRACAFDERGRAMTNEFHYRGCVIRTNPRSSNGGWTHNEVVENHLGSPVDDHFCAPGRSATRDGAVKAIVACGRRIIDERLQLYAT